MARDRWTSRTVFILAAVGSAVGLGNVWRFPYLAYEHGGGAFLIPYLTALMLIGIPLLMLEYAVGQKLQQGAVGAYRQLSSRFSGLGPFALTSGFIIAGYYVVVMSWCLLYLIAAPTTPWAENPQQYLDNEVLQKTESVEDLGGINWWVLGGLAAVWLMIYGCIYRGVHSVGRVVWITVPLPVALLAVLLVRAATVEGFGDGIAYYLRPDFSALGSIDVWSAAASQVFFTLTLGYGVMLAYASHKPEDADISADSFMTAGLNLGISLFAGFVVFGVIGGMAVSTGVRVEDAVAGGPGLAFVVFPKALSLMPAAGLFSVLFFLTLLMLGIDSAFPIVEAISIAIKDRWPEWSTAKIAAAICTAEFFVGIIFTTRGGVYLLEIVDHFATGFNLVLVGLLEAVLLGWFVSTEEWRLSINKVSDFSVGRWFNLAIAYVTPAALTALLVVQLYTEFTTRYGDHPIWALAIGWAAVLGPLVLLLAGFRRRPSE